MAHIISTSILCILGICMLVFTKVMVRFQVWSQHTIMGAQYVPSQRTYTAMRVIGVILVILGLIIILL